MRLIEKLAAILSAVARLFGGKANAVAATPPVQVSPPAAPAVAGFVKRALVDRFLLARRLASIARLNTPVGRKPRGMSQRSRDLPPIPQARLGAKKMQLDANRGPRVLVRQRPAQSIRSGAQLIPFPAPRQAHSAPARIAKAA